MIDLSRKNIIRISNETLFIKDNIEKVLRLIDILEMIFSSEWRDKLVLKGGTAINLFYSNMSRLSVDIDLDYLGKTKEEMIVDRDKIKTYLKNALFQKGYNLSDASKSHYALDSNVFQYINSVGNRDNIKIEINFLDRVHILPLSLKKVNGFNYYGSSDIQVLDTYELYASKFTALLSRCKIRDIYDSYNAIISNNLNDIELLKKGIIFYNCIGGNGDIINLDFSIIDGVTYREYIRMLRPVLSKNDEFDLELAKKTIKEFLNKIFVFTNNEKEFVRKFKEKIYQPDLLFSDEKLERISSHPMALWRCQSN